MERAITIATKVLMGAIAIAAALGIYGVVRGAILKSPPLISYAARTVLILLATLVVVAILNSIRERLISIDETSKKR